MSYAKLTQIHARNTRKKFYPLWIFHCDVFHFSFPNIVNHLPFCLYNIIILKYILLKQGLYRDRNNTISSVFQIFGLNRRFSFEARIFSHENIRE